MTEPMPEDRTEDPRTIDPGHGAGSDGDRTPGVWPPAGTTRDAEGNLIGPDGEPVGDPDALDTGDLLEVPVEERSDVDDDPANADAGADLSGVEEGTVVDVVGAEGDEVNDPYADDETDDPALTSDREAE